jgi:hypothetical protein
MSKPFVMALRFLVLLAFLLALSVVFAPDPATNSPYVSALLDLTVGPTLAATCDHTKCNERGSFGQGCSSTSLNIGCLGSRTGGCSNKHC